MTTTPNSALRAVRMGLLMSQDDLARAIREAGVPGASKRLVQRWEAGVTTSPRPVYARALEQVTGLPIEALGFAAPIPLGEVADDGRGGHDMTVAAKEATPSPVVHGHRVNHSGIWLSRYEYFSSGRGAAFVGLHHVVVLQHGSRLTVRSLPGSSDSSLIMDLVIDGTVITGTWTEETARDSYYQGARYHGAIQLLAEPTGRRMVGKWVGFGKEFDVNTGPWQLVFQDASTAKAAVERYNHRLQE
ncbi:helix-turn-helix transcriptional regulator [Streptomyces sp. XC 2026]|uniref:helix-turn-helix transcriptional regulator n=1 Tax=Streptomyces sp. XC 2026 TaxID=2782004 RepID=UPI0019039EA8|nr:helix-turn-helix transcriptional regulator [Streptomyces sp. XC 2026]